MKIGIKKIGLLLFVFIATIGCEYLEKESGKLIKAPNIVYILADVFGHPVPFAVRWPSRVKSGSISKKTICSTDLMATVADVLNIDLLANEGEDSYSILPLLENQDSEQYKRNATVHHSINGSFSIRKDQWKMIFFAGSGGWSDPKHNAKDITKLPIFQLYDLNLDPGEQTNLFGRHPKIEEELKQLMLQYIENGRSTPGAKQENDLEGYGSKDWSQLKGLKEKLN